MPAKVKKPKKGNTRRRLRKGPGRAGFPATFRAWVLAILDANGGCVRRTAAETGLPITTVGNWANGRPPTDPEVRAQKRRELYDILEDSVIGASRVDPTDGENYKHAAIGAGIYLDKMLLLRGLANQRTETTTMNATLSAGVNMNNLTFDDLAKLYELQQKARGVPALREASDLEHEETLDEESTT